MPLKSCDATPIKRTCSEPVEDAKAHIGIVVLRMLMIRIQAAVRSLDDERHSRVVRNLVQEPAASEEDVFAAMKMHKVLRDPGGKVAALIVKIELQLQMFRQIGFQTDRRKMKDIGRIFM